MIIVDAALTAREPAGNPVRLATIGARFMASGMANRIVTGAPGVSLAVSVNRHLMGAQRAYREAGLDHAKPVSRLTDLEDAIRHEVPVVTEGLLRLFRAEGIEALDAVTTPVSGSKVDAARPTGLAAGCTLRRAISRATQS